MRKDKAEAFRLRQEGKTYNQIKAILGVSKGTLSFWFNKSKWSREVSVQNHKVNYSAEKVRLMHSVRRKMLDEYYQQAENEAIEEYERYKNEPLFISALMLYAGEGDKSPNNGQVRIANVDSRIILTFKRFLEWYYPAMKPRIRLSILLYPDLNKEECVRWWKLAIQDELIQMHKPVLIHGKHKSRRLRYGVASLILSSTFLKKKIIKLIDLLFENQTAAIV